MCVCAGVMPFAYLVWKNDFSSRIIEVIVRTQKEIFSKNIG